MIKVKVNTDACMFHGRNFLLGYVYVDGTSMNIGIAKRIIESKEIPIRAKIPMVTIIGVAQILETLGLAVCTVASCANGPENLRPIQILKDEEES